jgi:RecB family exonuclease
LAATVLLERPEKNENVTSLSVSKIKVFESCKKQFFYSYIEKLPKKDYDYLIYGKFLHEVLEIFHKTYIEGSTEPFHIVMGESLKKSYPNWKEKLTPEQFAEGKNTLGCYLTDLAQQEKENRLPVFLAAEQSFFIDIDSKILLNGYIDRVQQDPDGMLHISDYKSSKSKKWLQEDLFQLKTYAYVMCLVDPDITRIRTSYIMLKHNMDLIVKEFDRDEVMELENYFLEKAALINVEKAYVETASPLCKGCSYLDICLTGATFLAKMRKKETLEHVGKQIGWDAL